MLALVGGDEFTPACRRMDRALLQALGGQALGGRRPRVLILPTAAALEDPERAARNGVAYFEGLGASAGASVLLARGDAQDAGLVAPLKEADLVYFAGGSPGHLLQTLRGTLAWRLITERHGNGLAIAGSSAGAMALAERMCGSDDTWRDALALIPGIAILPHFERQRAERIAALRATLDKRLVLLGIDSATACVNTGGAAWRVLGAGRVSLQAGGRPASYRQGQTLSWGPPASR